MMYTRQCPECGAEIRHGKRENRDRAVKRNQSCMSCARKKPVNPNLTHKLCSRCKESKSIAEFSKHTRSPDGLQSICKICNNKIGMDNYYQNKDRYKKLATLRQKDLQAKVAKLKTKPCTDCQKTFDPVCMDFDHLPQFEKKWNICYMLRRHMRWKLIEAEIAKCELVCANCHRLRSKTRGRS
jgi:hypothetical protein